MTEAKTEEQMDAIELAAHEWRIRLEDDLSEAEERQFREWVISDHAHGAEMAKAELGWSLLGELDLPSGHSHSFAPTADHTKTSVSFGQSIAELWSNLGRRLAAGALTAAALIAVFFAAGVPSLFDNDDDGFAQSYITDAGQTKRLELPDRSQLILGPKSELVLTLTEDARSAVLVDGNAFFKVRSDADRPFSVTTGLGSVTVTGTSFDVRYNSDAMFVSVGEGSVDVSVPQGPGPDDDQSVLALEAGQGIEITSAGLGEVVEVYPAEFAAWRSGQLSYLRAPLSKVVADLNRYSEVPVTISESAGNITLSGTFDTSDVDRLLTRLDEQLPVDVRRTQDMIEVVAD